MQYARRSKIEASVILRTGVSTYVKTRMDSVSDAA